MGKKISCWNLLPILKVLIVLFFCILGLSTQAQTDSVYVKKDSVSVRADSLSLENLATNSDTLASDSGKINPKKVKKISSNAITELVTYHATDSIRIEIKKNTAYLYDDSEVDYETMQLNADYIEIDFGKNELYASGIADDDGHVTGHPIFKGDGYEFDAHEIRYNLGSKKGKITRVIMEEEEGYIHGEQVKKLADNTSFLKNGKYTTCDLEHPHYAINFTKAKMMPNDKIITGPVYLTFEDVPTVIALPFGYFPVQKGRKSGIMMPKFGDAGTRGFSFRDFGYYFGISDNFDLKLMGGIYTRGSWEAKTIMNYVFRYKCSGYLEVGLAKNIFGEKNTDSYRTENDYHFNWWHRQDIKSHPNMNFSAHVNVVSKSYNTYNSTSALDYLSNQYESKINFSTNAKGIFFFDASVGYSQSTRTREVNFSLPEMSMNVNQFYPFRKKNKVGRLKWYDNISMKWGGQITNKLNTYDSILFKPETWQNLQSGMKQTVPLVIPVKIAKLINWNTSATLTEKWYLQSLDRTFEGDSATGKIVDKYKRGFYALHDLALSTSLTTKVYFMYQFKKGGLKAIRHVMTPTVDFTYRPDLNKGYNGTYYSPVTKKDVTYSHYYGSIFGGPYVGTQASVRLAIDNNLEMKVRSRRDTITGFKKVVLIENLRIATSYDFARDSLRWIPLEISGRTTLFKQLVISFALSFDPYCIGSDGVRVNELEIKKNNRLFRFASSTTDIGLGWTINQSLFTGKKKNSKTTDNTSTTDNSPFQTDQFGLANQRPDFTNPWSLTISYNFTYMTYDNADYYRQLASNKHTTQMVHTLNFRGELNITKKWKIDFFAGYDFVQKDITYTRINIYRDLHCWEMRFEWVPFGPTKGFGFTINVKASILQDVVKYNMKRNAWDQY